MAVVAMLASIRPILLGAMSSSSHMSWPRVLALLAGAVASYTWTVGLLALRSYLFEEQPFLLPNQLGTALTAFGGMLGVAALLARRGAGGMSERYAIRCATQAAAMALYVAAPVLAALALGLTRLLRSTMPWTFVKTRWRGILEGVLLLALCAGHLLASEQPLGRLGLGGLRAAGLPQLPL